MSLARPPLARLLLVALAASAAAACAEQGDDAARPPETTTDSRRVTTDAQPPVGARDAEVAATEAPPPTAAPIPSYDPATGYHLDEVIEYARPTRKPPAPLKKQIQITLRSTPPGALASVDGAVIGRTPTLWTGEANAERQFTFVLPGYVMARYRFIATTDGTVHGRLLKMTTDLPDAGAQAPPAN